LEEDMMKLGSTRIAGHPALNRPSQSPESLISIAGHIARLVGAAFLVACLALSSSGRAAFADPLLDETVSFTGQVLFLEHKVPALVIGAVRNGEISVHGFGERSEGGSAPDGETVLRIGSITKAFTGQVLANLVAEGKLGFTDTLATHAPGLTSGANNAVQRIRLIDLATHSAGLPREMPHEPGPENDPFATITREALAGWLKKATPIYPPGSGVLYSNVGFDMLAIALANAAKTPYPQLLDQHVTGPLGLKDTTFAPTDAQKARFMQGHGFDGKPLPDVPTGSVIVGAGGLYSTPNDLLRWMQWHLDRNAKADAEVRLLDHAIYLVRDGLNPVYGMDESGQMDAMGLAWVAMMPKADHPFILQKAGGLQGTFTYIAFAPEHGIAVFVAINKFDFGAAMAMAEAANELIANLAPR
jgi:D-alanyl-D-alanine-carboxypeptidase/D-alanyl-D-alanine-endopeptidase